MKKVIATAVLALTFACPAVASADVFSTVADARNIEASQPEHILVTVLPDELIRVDLPCFPYVEIR